MQAINTNPPVISNDDQVLNFAGKTVTVYYHQIQLLGNAESDYIFNTFSAFFNMLKQSLETGRLHYMLRGRVNLEEWQYEYKKVRTRKAHVLINYDRGILLYRYSLSPDAPVMIKFLTTEFTLASDNPSIENNVIVISKNYDSGHTRIDVHFVGSFRRLDEFLDVLSTLTHRDIDFSVADFRPIRIEFFVRYNHSREEQVAKMLTAIYRRFGYDDMDWKQKSNNKDVQYLKRVHVIFNNMKMHVKTYRRKNYKDPPQNYYDEPKLELALYFDRNDTLEDAKRKTRVALEFLASLVYSAGIIDCLIYEDSFETADAHINENIVELLSRATLSLDELYADIITDEVDRYILELLSQSNINSDMLSSLASAFDVSVRTVQRRLKKFERAGIIEKKKVKNNKYVWVVKPILVEYSRYDIYKIREVIERNKLLNIKLTKTDYIMLMYIMRGYVTASQLSKVMKLSRRTVNYHLRKLISAGLVISSRVGRTYKYNLSQSLVSLLQLI